MQIKHMRSFVNDTNCCTYVCVCIYNLSWEKGTKKPMKCIDLCISCMFFLRWQCPPPALLILFGDSDLVKSKQINQIGLIGVNLGACSHGTGVSRKTRLTLTMLHRREHLLSDPAGWGGGEERATLITVSQLHRVGGRQRGINALHEYRTRTLSPFSEHGAS